MSVQKDALPVPSMGVLVSEFTIYSLRNKVASLPVQLLVEANKQVNLNLYYFSERGINLRERKINGVYWDEQKNIWLPAQFAFPDVLYIRGGIINQEEFNLFRLILKNNKAKIINYPGFNKWYLYHIIKKDQSLENYLPVTMIVSKPQDIQKMLLDYKTVYLKPHNGSLGKYVLRVDDLSNEHYLCSYFKHNQKKPIIITINGFQALVDQIYKFFHRRKFFIQQAIDLLKYENRLTDMRAEVQRDGYGNLEIIGISARLAKPNSPITTHGDAVSMDHFFKEMLSYPQERIEEIQSKVREFIFRVYECIERQYGKYAELGIDFAVDKNDRIWFIECNSQSTKQSLIKAYGYEVLFKSCKNVLEYARYITNRQ